MPNKIAIQFVFDAEQMKTICEGKEKVLITSYLETVKTKGGESVGALRVDAEGKGKAKAKGVKALKAPKGGKVIYGCPIPPCSED
jgi:hypothetical protein